MIKYNNSTIDKLATDATVNKMYYGGNVAYIAPPLVEPSYKATIITTAGDVLHVSDNGSSVLTKAEITAVTSVTAVAQIIVGDIVTEIGERCIYKFTALKVLDLPSTLTEIGNQSIYYDSALTAIYCRAITPPNDKNENNFYNTNNCPIYVPTESVEAYKAASGWRSFTSRIQAIPT